MKTKLTILFLLLVLVMTTGFGCKGGDEQAKQALLTSVELNIWGVYDSSDAFKQIIEAYQLVHPNVKINYQKLRWEEYEEKLLDAWAEGTGPDIFSVHNTWFGKYQNKILPLPSKIQLPVIETSSGLFGSEKRAVIKEFSSLSAFQIRDIFPDVVYSDVVKDNFIYGLPLSIDTLALFYNREHLNSAGLVSPPSTWQELIDATSKLTLQDNEGQIVRSAVALGGSKNINRSNDVLSLLMLQNGTAMVNDRNNITFDEASATDRKFYPGQQALKFYTDFASPAKEIYTWNEDLLEATELFAVGKLSMVFGFSYHIPILKAQAPKIDFGISSALHINANGSDALGLPINVANYWAYSVFKNSSHPNEAWDFILFMTTRQYKDENGKIRYYAENYLDQTQKPPALKSLINTFKTNYPEYSVFADQILTSQNWYHGQDPDNMNSVFKQMITNVVTGKMDVKDALNSAAKAVQNSY